MTTASGTRPSSRRRSASARAWSRPDGVSGRSSSGSPRAASAWRTIRRRIGFQDSQRSAAGPPGYGCVVSRLSGLAGPAAARPPSRRPPASRSMGVDSRRCPGTAGSSRPRRSRSRAPLAHARRRVSRPGRGGARAPDGVGGGVVGMVGRARGAPTEAQRSAPISPPPRRSSRPAGASPLRGPLSASPRPSCRPPAGTSRSGSRRTGRGAARLLTDLGPLADPVGYANALALLGVVGCCCCSALAASEAPRAAPRGGGRAARTARGRRRRARLERRGGRARGGARRLAARDGRAAAGRRADARAPAGAARRARSPSTGRRASSRRGRWDLLAAAPPGTGSCSRSRSSPRPRSPGRSSCCRASPGSRPDAQRSRAGSRRSPRSCSRSLPRLGCAVRAARTRARPLLARRRRTRSRRAAARHRCRHVRQLVAADP